jgi:Fic family protein
MWNWLNKKWPKFIYDLEKLNHLELEFSQNVGMVMGVLTHISDENKSDFLVDILSSEALKTSEIEGEYLNRDSLQSSVKKRLGFTSDVKKVAPAEYGVSEMIVDLHLNFGKRLSHGQMFEWHNMITNGRRDLVNQGEYRTHQEPMQVVSGALGREKIHFEAPPSSTVKTEMKAFVEWFNGEHFGSNAKKNGSLVKAGITHLYFVCIHPFEDGNGRIGRALAEKSLALSLGEPTFILLSHAIEAQKKNYYESLENNNKELDITEWLLYFGKTVIKAQNDTIQRIKFLIDKTKFFDRYSKNMNSRQQKVIYRIFEAGHEGFKGGLSAKNYMTISKTSTSTTTRDLNDLIEKHILRKEGELKGTRYFLNF